LKSQIEYKLPLPVDKDYRALFSALEAWKDEELETVEWPKILEAIIHRE